MVSGIAGPSGGSPEKPVGRVWFAWGRAGEDIKTELKHFPGDRQGVQQQAVLWALEGCLSMVATKNK